MIEVYVKKANMGVLSKDAIHAKEIVTKVEARTRAKSAPGGKRRDQNDDIGGETGEKVTTDDVKLENLSDSDDSDCHKFDEEMASMRQECAVLRRRLLCSQNARRTVMNQFSEMRSAFFRQVGQTKQRLEHIKQAFPEMDELISQAMDETGNVQFFDADKFVDQGSADYAQGALSNQKTIDTLNREVEDLKQMLSNREYEKDLLHFQFSTVRGQYEEAKTKISHYKIQVGEREDADGEEEEADAPEKHLLLCNKGERAVVLREDQRVVDFEHYSKFAEMEARLEEFESGAATPSGSKGTSNNKRSSLKEIHMLKICLEHQTEELKEEIIYYKKREENLLASLTGAIESHNALENEFKSMVDNNPVTSRSSGAKRKLAGLRKNIVLLILMRVQFCLIQWLMLYTFLMAS